MLRVSLLLSICLHLILLCVTSVMFSFKPPPEKNVEHKFQVEFHKTVITNARLPQKQCDMPYIKNSDHQLPRSRELPALATAVVKRQLVKNFSLQSTTPITTFQKQASNIQPLPKFTPSIEDITLIAHELQRRASPPKQQPLTSASLDSTATPENQTAYLATSQIQANVLDEYLQEIIKKIYAAQYYPYQARRNGWEGTIVVELTILASGKVEKVAVIERSKYALLDESALKTLQKIKTFPPFPEGFTSESITVTIPIQFQLKTH